ncbi:MAG: alpha/beta hydrolase [Chitinispirillaceae bacterium]|nr:alpha/beta hydrolase [Chitinispirillaceae bacterium]
MNYCPLIIICLTFIVSGNPSLRYREKVFNQVRITSDVLYGSNNNYRGEVTDLYLDVYEPVDDTATNRPCVVFAHGGAFITGQKTEPVTAALCEELALRGYVTVSIQYRLGTSLNYTSFVEAIVRAVQDMKAAVRFMREHHSTYGINAEKIAVGGVSAGGVTALHYAFMDNEELPSEVDTTVLGGIEGTGGTPGVKSDISCVVNCWGAIGDTAFIQADERIPVISFHGTEDNVVPYDAGFAFGMSFLPLYGSAAVDRQCRRLGITSALHTYEGMGHGHGVDERMDTTVALTSSFLYDNLFTAAPVVQTPSRIQRLPNRSPVRMVVATGKAKKDFFSKRNTAGAIFRPDGKTFGNARLNGKRAASGGYLLRSTQVE